MGSSRLVRFMLLISMLIGSIGAAVAIQVFRCVAPSGLADLNTTGHRGLTTPAVDVPTHRA